MIFTQTNKQRIVPVIIPSSFTSSHVFYWLNKNEAPKCALPDSRLSSYFPLQLYWSALCPLVLGHLHILFLLQETIFNNINSHSLSSVLRAHVLAFLTELILLPNLSPLVPGVSSLSLPAPLQLHLALCDYLMCHPLHHPCFDSFADQWTKHYLLYRRS